jgi:hypothetical protein
MTTIQITTQTTSIRTACEKNDIVHLIYLLAQNVNIVDLRNGFYSACILGHYKIVEILINYRLVYLNNIDQGFLNACIHNYTDIVKLLINTSIKNYNILNYHLNLNHGMSNACHLNNIDLMKVLISYGANNFNECVFIAAQQSSTKIIKLMIDHGANRINININLLADVLNLYGTNIPKVLLDLDETKKLITMRNIRCKNITILFSKYIDYYVSKYVLTSYIGYELI